MNKVSFAIVTFIILAFSIGLESMAQKIGNGCLVTSGINRGRIYQDYMGEVVGLPAYYTTNYFINSANCVSYSIITSGGCRYESPPNSNSYVRGDLIKINIINCPIDNHIIILGFGLLGFCLYRLRKMQS